MPVRKEYTPEFNDEAVRFVLEEIEADESRKQACERLGPKLTVKAVSGAIRFVHHLRVVKRLSRAGLVHHASMSDA